MAATPRERNQSMAANQHTITPPGLKIDRHALGTAVRLELTVRLRFRTVRKLNLLDRRVLCDTLSVRTSYPDVAQVWNPAAGASPTLRLKRGRNSTLFESRRLLPHKSRAGPHRTGTPRSNSDCAALNGYNRANASGRCRGRSPPFLKTPAALRLENLTPQRLELKNRRVGSSPMVP